MTIESAPKTVEKAVAKNGRSVAQNGPLRRIYLKKNKEWMFRNTSPERAEKPFVNKGFKASCSLLRQVWTFLSFSLPSPPTFRTACSSDLLTSWEALASSSC